MTVEVEQGDMLPGPSTSNLHEEVTPASKLGLKYFDKEMWYAPPRQNGKSKIEICKTLLPVLDSPMSLPQHEKGPSLDTPQTQTTRVEFLASYHVQNTMPYQNVSEIPYTGCMICGRSVDAIKNEKVEWYMRRSTRQNEPESSQDSEGRRVRMNSPQAAFFSLHPLCRRLQPVMAQQ